MVSLIVPFYNSENYLDRCLNSILIQSDKDIELILVNDGSTDKSGDIVKRYLSTLKKELSRVVYIEQHNQGVGAACNRAFKEVTGQYLSLLDSDDMLLADSIALRRGFLDTHPQYDIVRTNGFYVMEDDLNNTESLFVTDNEIMQKKRIFEDLLNGTAYGWPGSYMVRMSVLDDLYPDRNIYPSRSGQNLQFLLIPAYYCKSGFIDIPLMIYVIRQNSLSHFSTGDIYEKELEAMRGYKDIRDHLITKYIDSPDKEYWLKENTKLYNRIFFNLAAKYNQKNELKEYYRQMKANKQLDVDLRIQYYKSFNQLIWFFLKCYKKLFVQR